MQIIGNPAEIERLDPAVKRLLDAAWSPPSTDPSTAGFRQRKQGFPKKREIMRDAATAIDAWLGREDETYVFDFSRDAFVRQLNSEDDRILLYRYVMDAWNAGRDLGECQNCGTLFSPRKGRIAKYCSGRCRTQSARSA